MRSGDGTDGAAQLPFKIVGGLAKVARETLRLIDALDSDHAGPPGRQARVPSPNPHSTHGDGREPGGPD
jgi:hypothetical protein